MQAFENEDYMTAAMYLLALLDNRVNKLVDFPNQRMSTELNILMMALRIKRRRILDSLPKNEASCQRKYTFWKCILR